MSAVTVGLPVYNGEEFLDRALECLCAQTFPDLTVLISDNASSDASPRIISAWAARDARIRVHRQPGNVGAMANFRWVLDRADSPWFMYAAHDDEWSPNYVQVLHRAITARPGLLMAVPRLVTFIDTPQRPVKIRRYPARLDQLAGTARIRFGLRRSRPGWFYSLFDRQMLSDALRRASELNQIWAEDLLTILHVLLTGEVTGSDEAIYYKRGSAASQLAYAPKTARERYALYRRFLQRAFAALAATPLRPLERASVIPALWRFARYVDKPNSILRAAIRERLR